LLGNSAEIAAGSVVNIVLS